MAKKRRAEDMTTDEAMKTLFPRKAIREADEVAGKTGESVDDEDDSLDMDEE